MIATPSRIARTRFVLSARNARSMTRVARRNPGIGRYQTFIHVEQRADRTVSDGMGLDAPASVDARIHNREHLVRMNAGRAVSDESPPTRVSDEINPSRPSGVGERATMRSSCDAIER